MITIVIYAPNLALALASVSIMIISKATIWSALTDTARSILYNRNVFIIQATSVTRLSGFVLSVIMLRVGMQSVVMLSVVMLSVVMLSVVMLSVIMLSVVMLSVVMLSVVMLSVIMLSVVAPTTKLENP